MLRKIFTFLSLLIPLCFVMPVCGADAQITVTGTVMCQDEACAGATVHEYAGETGTTNGVAADKNGYFTITVTVGNRIKISCTGQKDVWKDIDDDTTEFGIINMEVEPGILEDVVVVGIPCTITDEEKSSGILKKRRFDGDDECYPSACIGERWKIEGEGKKAKCKEQECKFDNGTGGWVKDGEVLVCKLKECKNGYQRENNEDGSGEYCREMLKKCSDAQAKEHPNATKTGIKKGTEICVAQECKCGFDLKEGACVVWENKACTADTKPRLPDNAATAKMVCENDKAVCKIEKCVSDDYELKDNKCESKNKQPCTPQDKNATAGEYKNRDGKLVCVVTSCKQNYNVDKDNNKCVPGMVLSEEDQKARVAELEENAKKMKDKEQSMENKLLGAAGMGMTGMGMMQSMSAGAEQKADEAAELDMAAYLATMHCNYAPGKNVQGGEKEIELPGANSLLPLYTEYVALANDLKVRKEALGLRPGIESEAILDGATSGLYDDVALGKTGGAYTSLARALSDPNGEDAKKWAAQKEETAKDKKTGTILAAVGAIGSAVANIAINKNAPKESSDEINAKYEEYREKYVYSAAVLKNSVSEPFVEPEETTVTGGDVVPNGDNVPASQGDDASIFSNAVAALGDTAAVKEKNTIKYMEYETVAMSDVIGDNGLTENGKNMLDALLEKQSGYACFVDVVLKYPYIEGLSDEAREQREMKEYANQKLVEKYLASKSKNYDRQVSVLMHWSSGGGCDKESIPCPYVKTKINCIEQNQLAETDTSKTAWSSVQADLYENMRYGGLGEGIHQSSTRGEYKSYLENAKQVCERNNGVFKERIDVFPKVNINGTYNTFFNVICDFGTEDTSSGSMRCHNMCTEEFGQPCQQTGSFGSKNFTGCFIPSPTK